jgi:hypothetical protein
MIELPNARPNNLQLRFAVGIWTGDQGIGAHPVVGMRHSLLGCKQRQYSGFLTY